LIKKIGGGNTYGQFILTEGRKNSKGETRVKGKEGIPVKIHN